MRRSIGVKAHNLQRRAGTASCSRARFRLAAIADVQSAFVSCSSRSLWSFRSRVDRFLDLRLLCTGLRALRVPHQRIAFSLAARWGRNEATGQAGQKRSSSSLRPALRGPAQTTSAHWVRRWTCMGLGPNGACHAGRRYEEFRQNADETCGPSLLSRAPGSLSQR